jgi:hypothetical protein
MHDRLFYGNQELDRTCGILEFLWPALWGGSPLTASVEEDRVCGPLCFTDLARDYGFIFYHSEDGSVENGVVPNGYLGTILNEGKGLIPPGYKGISRST